MSFIANLKRFFKERTEKKAQKEKELEEASSRQRDYYIIGDAISAAFYIGENAMGDRLGIKYTYPDAHNLTGASAREFNVDSRLRVVLTLNHNPELALRICRRTYEAGGQTFLASIMYETVFYIDGIKIPYNLSDYRELGLIVSKEIERRVEEYGEGNRSLVKDYISSWGEKDVPKNKRTGGKKIVTERGSSSSKKVV